MNTQQIEAFLQKSSDLPNLIVIYGPTASGKTSMSIEIAKYLDTEIISTDSRQIFTGMDIGTGKITEEEKEGIPHHMIDIVTPDKKYSVSEYKREASKHIQKLHRIGKIPLLVGGTGLYIDSIIYDFSVDSLVSDPTLRESFNTLSNDELYLKLQDIDLKYASELHPNNRPYVERALEIKLLTGKSKKDYRREKKLCYDVLFLTPKNPEGTIYREWLYERINLRVQQMFAEGLKREVQGLLNLGYTFKDFGLNSIGYKEFEEYFLGNISKEECMSLVQQHSRNYAKRQLTWFRKYENTNNL